jgi:hypothetical protein
MYLMVHVKNKCIPVSCGEGHQQAKWLAHVGVARYDDTQGRSLGLPVGIRLENGTILGGTQTLSEAGLKDMQHVWVVFKEQNLTATSPQKQAIAARQPVARKPAGAVGVV